MTNWVPTLTPLPLTLPIHIHHARPHSLAQMSAAARIAQAQARMAPPAAATTPTGIPQPPGMNVNRGMTVAERTAQAAR